MPSVEHVPGIIIAVLVVLIVGGLTLIGANPPKKQYYEIKPYKDRHK